MHRFFAERTGENTAALPPEEEAHALRVLRLEAGDACQALLEGKIYAARILETAPRVTLALEEELPSTEPSVHVTLYQGIPKGDKMDYVAQKCTEAGVRRIVPVRFSRCVAQWTDREADKKRARFQRIAAEAAKQAGRAAVPEIAAPISFDGLTKEIAGFELALVPWEEASGKGMASHLAGQKEIAIVIGPEGGMSAAEIGRLREAGAVPVTLGPRIFRTETAGLAALVSLLTLTHDMGI